MIEPCSSRADGSDDVARAAELPPFRDASEVSKARLFADAIAYDFAANSVLWRKGEIPKHLHVLLSGFIGVKTIDRRANEYIIDFIRPGTVIILPPVILGTAYLFPGVTLMDSRILMVPAPVFVDCLRSDAALSFAVNKLLCDERANLARHVEILKTRSPAERLAGLLLSLANRPDGAAVVQLPCERQMIAAWLGVVPSSASRAFRELESACGIEGRGRQIRVPSIEHLAECAGAGPHRMKGPAA